MSVDIASLSESSLALVSTDLVVSESPELSLPDRRDLRDLPRLWELVSVDIASLSESSLALVSTDLVVSVPDSVSEANVSDPLDSYARLFLDFLFFIAGFSGSCSNRTCFTPDEAFAALLARPFAPPRGYVTRTESLSDSSSVVSSTLMTSRLSCSSSRSFWSRSRSLSSLRRAELMLDPTAHSQKSEGPWLAAFLTMAAGGGSVLLLQDEDVNGAAAGEWMATGKTDVRTDEGRGRRVSTIHRRDGESTKQEE